MEMSDLPRNLREILESSLSLYSLSEDKITISRQTQKAVLKLHDGKTIESVLMDYGDWQTACISSQVGCPLGCTFCATGKMGFQRNLTSDEIVDQVLYWNRRIYPKYVGRVVLMGMGEPFLNWDNVYPALNTLHDDLGLGWRKISISTAGVISGIEQFTKLNLEINLAISLHSLDPAVRKNIMPITQTNPLDKLINSIEKYVKITHRQVFFEYALMRNVNDTPAQLNLLIDFLKTNNLFYLNLINLNPIKGGLLPSGQLNFFISELDKAGIKYSLRRSMGSEINSACGQLITENKV